MNLDTCSAFCMYIHMCFAKRGVECMSLYLRV